MHISRAHAQTHAAVIPNTETDSKVVFPMETHPVKALAAWHQAVLITSEWPVTHS